MRRVWNRPIERFPLSHAEKNHGLGRVNGEMQLYFKYPGWMKFKDEGGDASKGNRISYIRPDENSGHTVRLVRAKKSSRLDESRPFTNQSINRSLRLLHPWRTSQRKKQHTWRRGGGRKRPRRSS